MIRATLFALLVASAPALAFDRAPRSLMGWHPAGGVQVHYASQETQLPWVGVWTRTPLDPSPGQPPGQWLHVKVLINCDEWFALPFGIADESGHMMLAADVTGRDPEPQPATPGAPLSHLVSGVCGQFGYVPPERRPIQGFPSGSVIR